MFRKNKKVDFTFEEVKQMKDKLRVVDVSNYIHSKLTYVYQTRKKRFLQISPIISIAFLHEDGVEFIVEMWNEKRHELDYIHSITMITIYYKEEGHRMFKLNEDPIELRPDSIYRLYFLQPAKTQLFYETLKSDFD